MPDAKDRWYDSEVPGHVLVRCPDCGAIMHFGPGWRGRDPPLCPDCTPEADAWEDDPRVTMGKFLTLVDDES